MFRSSLNSTFAKKRKNIQSDAGARARPILGLSNVFFLAEGDTAEGERQRKLYRDNGALRLSVL